MDEPDVQLYEAYRLYTHLGIPGLSNNGGSYSTALDVIVLEGTKEVIGGRRWSSADFMYCDICGAYSHCQCDDSDCPNLPEQVPDLIKVHNLSTGEELEIKPVQMAPQGRYYCPDGTSVYFKVE